MLDWLVWAYWMFSQYCACWLQTELQSNVRKKMWLKQKLALLYAWKSQQPLLISRMYVTIKSLWLALLLEPILLTGGKNPSQQRGSLPILQVLIRLTNVWYGRPDRSMDPLPSMGWFESVKINQEKEYQLGLSYSNFLESNSNLI